MTRLMHAAHGHGPCSRGTKSTTAHTGREHGSRTLGGFYCSLEADTLGDKNIGGGHRGCQGLRLADQLQ